MDRRFHPWPRAVSLAFATLGALVQLGCRDAAAPDVSARASPAFTQAAAQQVVFPTGQYPADVARVRAAVALGGTVLLKATDEAGTPTDFNFGPAAPTLGFVITTADVEIVGETVNGRMTTIHGGNAPIRSNRLTHVAVRGIAFDGPRIAAAIVNATLGFEVSDSRVSNVVPFPFVFDPDDGLIYKGQAIWVNPSSRSAVSGVIAIRNNDFVNAGLNGAIDGYGIALVPGAARVVITGNRISGANLAGIIVIGPSDEVLIENNTITPGAGDSHPHYFGNGIHVLGESRSAPGYVVARNNTIIVEGEEAHGVFIFGDSAFNHPVERSVIDGNLVSIRGGTAGIGYYGRTSGGIVRANRIRGDAAYALASQRGFFDPDEPSVGHLFIGNNISGFTAGVADVFFDQNTVGHSLVGNSGTVMDLGTGNRITGTAAGPSRHLGPSVAAVRYLRQIAPRTELAGLDP